MWKIDEVKKVKDTRFSVRVVEYDEASKPTGREFIEPFGTFDKVRTDAERYIELETRIKVRIKEFERVNVVKQEEETMKATLIANVSLEDK